MASAHRPMTVVMCRREVPSRATARAAIGPVRAGLRAPGYSLPMSPRSLPHVPARVATVLVALAAAAVLIAGCSFGAAAFDPNGPCTTDGRAAGAYPDLEALVPSTLDGKSPASLDSGRKCTSDGLATLASHGITEVRFAGAVWPTGAESGTSLAVFSAPGLTPAWLGESYEAGARASSKVSGYTATTPVVQGRQGYRLDAENNGNLQTVVVWPAPAGPVMRVAIVSGAARDGTTLASQQLAVQRAIAAFPS